MDFETYLTSTDGFKKRLALFKYSRHLMKYELYVKKNDWESNFGND